MLTACIALASCCAGIILGGLSVRASMDRLVRAARADRDLSDDDWRDEHERHVETLAELDKTWAENVRLRQHNAALRERCGAPPELDASDLQVAS